MVLVTKHVGGALRPKLVSSILHHTHLTNILCDEEMPM